MNNETYTALEIERENLAFEVNDNISNILAKDRSEEISKNLRSFYE